MEQNWSKKYEENRRQKESRGCCKSPGMEKLFKEAADECKMRMQEFERDVEWLYDPECPMPDAGTWMWRRWFVTKAKKSLDEIISKIESEMLYQALRNMDVSKFPDEYLLPELLWLK